MCVCVCLPAQSLKRKQQNSCSALKHRHFPRGIWISGFSWKVRRPNILGSCSHSIPFVSNALAAALLWRAPSTLSSLPQASSGIHPHLCYLTGPRRHEDLWSLVWRWSALVLEFEGSWLKALHWHFGDWPVVLSLSTCSWGYRHILYFCAPDSDPLLPDRFWIHCPRVLLPVWSVLWLQILLPAALPSHVSHPAFLQKDFLMDSVSCYYPVWASALYPENSEDQKPLELTACGWNAYSWADQRGSQCCQSHNQLSSENTASLAGPESGIHFSVLLHLIHFACSLGHWTHLNNNFTVMMITKVTIMTTVIATLCQALTVF